MNEYGEFNVILGKIHPFQLNKSVLIPRKIDQPTNLLYLSFSHHHELFSLLKKLYG